MPRTGFHIVDISPWPFCCSVGVLGLASSTIGFLHLGVIPVTSSFFLLSVLVLVVTMFRWWGDIVLESTYLGRHTSLVVRNLRVGMILFIMSEIFFFVSFFWAFFNSMLGEISMKDVGHWPPVGIKPIYPWKVPALNTAVLISSGITLTVAHKILKIHNKCPLYIPDSYGKKKKNRLVFWLRATVLAIYKNILWFISIIPFFSAKLRGAYGSYLLKEAIRSVPWKRKKFNFTPKDRWTDWAEATYLKNNPKELYLKQQMATISLNYVLFFLGLTILLGLYFTWLQYNEYYVASFTLADSVYGSTFYLMTGFHGVHVLVGTIFLIVCWFRCYYYHFSFQRHYFGFDAAVWYWHFVDGVWVFLFFTVYVWGYM